MISLVKGIKKGNITSIYLDNCGVNSCDRLVPRILVRGSGDFNNLVFNEIETYMGLKVNPAPHYGNGMWEVHDMKKNRYRELLTIEDQTRYRTHALFIQEGRDGMDLTSFRQLAHYIAWGIPNVIEVYDSIFSKPVLKLVN